MGLRMRSTQPTPPARKVTPSIISASSCTRPSRVRKLPRPASNVSSSSMQTMAASTASRAGPPPSRTCQPLASAFWTPLVWASTMSSGMAQAPPWTTITGSCRNVLGPLVGDKKRVYQTSYWLFALGSWLLASSGVGAEPRCMNKFPPRKIFGNFRSRYDIKGIETRWSRKRRFGPCGRERTCASDHDQR